MMQTPSNIVPILLLYLAYGINCKTDLPINLTILECPEDFIAIGHAWIGPMINDDASKLNGANERANYTSKKYHYHLEKKSYKSDKFGICIICNHLDVEVEVCSSNSRIFIAKFVHYEKEYGAFNLNDHNQNLVDWYNKSDVCAISFQQQSIQLLDALLGIKPIECQQKLHHIEHKKVSQKANESYLGLMCPNDSVLESFEKRNTLSESKQSTCIVCTSLFQKYSLCLCNNCSKGSNAVDYSRLTIENSLCIIENKIIYYSNVKKCPINEIFKPTNARLFCGYQFHLNYNSSQNLSKINSTQLLFCKNEKEENTFGESSFVVQFSTLILAISLISMMFIIMLIIVVYLILKLKRPSQNNFSSTKGFELTETNFDPYDELNIGEQHVSIQDDEKVENCETEMTNDLNERRSLHIGGDCRDNAYIFTYCLSEEQEQ